MMHGSFDQSISPYKSHLKNPKKFHQNPTISNPSDAFWHSHFNSTGLLQPPPFLSQSYPPYSLHQSPQPPLLPLPAGAPRRSSSARGLSCSPLNKKASNPSLTSKKSKSPKKEGKNSPKKSKDVAIGGERKCEIGGGVSSVLVVSDQVDMFSGSAVFMISPPPSSLPLPTFSLRPKLSCKAAGVDAGATDDLRRLLRLR